MGLDAALGVVLGDVIAGDTVIGDASLCLPSLCGWSVSPEGLWMRNKEPEARFCNRQWFFGGRRWQIPGKAKAMAIPASHRKLGNSGQG